MICKECKSSKIKSRRNYSHGKKSKSTTTFVCIKCGSTNVEVLKSDDRRRPQRKR